MAALPYIQLYVADYLADTAHLTTIEHGAYLLLIFNYWQKGNSFKAKDERTLNKRLATVARMNEQEWENAKETLSEYFEINENEWVHSRIERDLEQVNSKSTKASAAGKLSAQKRANSKATDNKEESNERSTNAQRTFNHTDTDTDTDTDTNTDKSKSIRDKSRQDKIEKTKREIFKIPELQEVCRLVADENLNLDAAAFINFYESKGWVIGKSKMKDWKAAARGWSSRNTQKNLIERNQSGLIKINSGVNSNAYNNTNYRKQSTSELQLAACQRAIEREEREQQCRNTES